MIVASRTKRGLKDCFDSLQSTSREEFKLFKAICRSLDYDEVRSFYGIYLSNEKVTTMPDSVSADVLHLKYPLTDATVIQKVLDQQTTWTSCCDVLNSLVSSHGTVLLDSLQFSIDDFDWPSVQESMLRCTRDKNRKLDDELDWTIFELDALDFTESNANSSGENVKKSVDNEDENIFNETSPDYSSEPNEATVSVAPAADDIKDDWEVVNYDAEASDAAQKTRMASNSGLLSYTAGSYRDVLMIPAIESIKKRLCPEPKRNSPQTEWRPVFKVVKTGRQRVDRTYGMSITSNETYQDGWVEDLFSSQLEMYVRAPIHE